MSSLPKPAVILTHESDLDGFLSGLLLQRLARALFQEEVRLESYHYHAWRQRDMKETSAWVCDLPFETRLDRAQWMVVDHHPADPQPRHARLVHDLTKSAGLLCYEMCREHGLGSPELDRLVRLNNVSDLFLENDPEFEEAGDYASLVKVYGFWNMHAILEGRLEALLDHPLLEVIRTKRRVEDPIGLAWSRQHVTALAPGIGFVETVLGNTNQIVYQLLGQPDMPYHVLISIFRRPNGLMIASLRSRDGQALPVAERLQGGGHPNACGATLPRSLRTIADAIGYLRQMLNPVAAAGNPLQSLEQVFDSMKWEQNPSNP
jgi:oligoribonuclease NrnB/cAMP/cGMP phosphodiesterase (DHH superfamily)